MFSNNLCKVQKSPISTNEILELNRNLSAKDADHRNLQEKLDQQKSEIEKIQERFQSEFKNLANDKISPE